MRWPAPRQRVLAHLALTVTESPWTLSPSSRAQAHASGLSDDELLHAICSSAYFGHLNRIADATSVPLDYLVRAIPPVAEPATPPLDGAPSGSRAWKIGDVGSRGDVGTDVEVGTRGGATAARASTDAAVALTLSMRPATAAALASWREYLAGKLGPLSPSERALVASHAAALVGGDTQHDPSLVGLAESIVIADEPEIAPSRARSLVALAETVALAPWALTDAVYADLRASGATDEELFDIVATASTANFIARIDTALRALASN